MNDSEPLPLEVGLTPSDVGLAPLDDSPPSDVGLAPSDVGLTPLEVGLTPLEVGLTPLDDSPPSQVGLTPLDDSPPSNVELAPLDDSPPSDVGLTPLDDSPPSDELAYPDGIYQYILNMCFFHPINIIAAFYYGNPICGTMGIVLSITSVNYWRNPLMNSTRRYIDMVVAFIAVPYHIYLSLFTTNKLLCAVPIISGALAYPFSIWLEQKKYIKTAAFFHCVLHGLVIFGATMTYRDYYLYSK
jgi:hypothetical protein